jgi:putative transposase
MCNVLQVNRSTYYNYVKREQEEEKKETNEEEVLAEEIQKIFDRNRETYGTRRIKGDLEEEGFVVSRRRIGHIMKQKGLVSCYTKPSFRVHKSSTNEAPTANLLDRQFTQDREKKAVVSDLTYVQVGDQWNYICTLVDLFNREIIGFSTGRQKDAELVLRAFASVPGDLHKIDLFHTDRGSEFANHQLDEFLDTFAMKRSLSKKGCPYDNAVAEATFKTIKTEFVKRKKFSSLERLNLEFQDYVHWFNHFRRHSTLGYLSPINYKLMHLQEAV